MINRQNLIYNLLGDPTSEIHTTVPMLLSQLIQQPMLNNGDTTFSVKLSAPDCRECPSTVFNSKPLILTIENTQGQVLSQTLSQNDYNSRTAQNKYFRVNIKGLKDFYVTISGSGVKPIYRKAQKPVIIY